MKKIKLVLSGSGTKFPVFVGALKRLEEAGCVIEEVVGTSGGSIIAAAIASGLDSKALTTLCHMVMPKLQKLVDFSLTRLFTDWGFIGGNKIEEELAKHFNKTLGDMKIPLYIVTANFDTEELHVFSSHSHPQMETVRPVRASMSIPLIFVPKAIEGDFYIDGGIMANFAVDHFGDNPETVGLYFQRNIGRKPRPKGWKSLFVYIGRIIDMLISAKTLDDIDDATHASIIPLKTKQDGLDFTFTWQEIDSMIKEGYECTDKWLKANPGKLK